MAHLPRATWTKGYLRRECGLANLSFETRKLLDHPLLVAQIGRMPMVAAYDMGQCDVLFTSEAGSVTRSLKGNKIGLEDDMV